MITSLFKTLWGGDEDPEWNEPLLADEEELDGLAEELSNILGWVEQLNEVDTEGVAPMSSVIEGMELRPREDKVTDGNCRDAVLSNAPATRDGFFVVPKVIE